MNSQPTSFEGLCEEFGPPRGELVRFFIRRNVKADRACDLTQDALIRLGRRLEDTGKPLRNPKAWLMTTASNILRDSARHIKVVGTKNELMGASEMNETMDHADAVAGRVDLASAMERLKPHNRLLLCLRYEKHLTYSLIGQELGISEQLAGKVCRNADAELQRRMGDR